MRYGTSTVDTFAGITKQEDTKHKLCIASASGVGTIITVRLNFARGTFTVLVSNTTVLAVIFTFLLVVLQKNMHIYNIVSIDSACSVQSADDDPRNVSMLDKDFVSLFDINYDKFTQEEADGIKHMLLKHKSLFAFNDHQLGCLKDVKYHMELIDPTPVKQRYRPLHPNLRDQVHKQLQTMLQSGVISESTSPWNSPLVVAKKKDGSLRLCVDFRCLNAQAKKDAKPLPRIDDTLSLLNGNSFFSSLDLISGYWQLMLDDESKPLTAFSAGSETLYEFNRVPFGYSSSGMCFQRSIEAVLKDVMYTHCLVYLDDILVKSPDLKSHLHSLDLVFTRLSDSGLKLKPKKCDLFTNEVKFLGFLVSPDGIHPDPDKTTLIKEWAVPDSTKAVRQYLGIIGYYRKFIPKFSLKAAPLTELLKGKLVKRGNHKTFVPVQFYWTETQQQSFEELRRVLLEEVCLTHPDFNLPFTLEIDASRGALGAVLSQEKDGKLRPIAFASRKTNTAESNYAAHRLEFLALKWAVTNKFKDYLQYAPFKVLTDNNPLLYILRKLDIDAVSQRWAAELSKYDFEIIYRSGKSNTAADSLSRLTTPTKDNDALLSWCHEKSHTVNAILQGSSESKDELIHHDANDETEVLLEKAKLMVGPNQILDWKQIQASDLDIQFVINHVVNNGSIKYKDVKKTSRIVKSLYKMRSSLYIRNGLLFRQITPRPHETVYQQLILNHTCLPVLFFYYHEQQGHLGEDRTLQLFRERFYWPKMSYHVRNLVKCCSQCQARKTLPTKHKEEMYHRPLTSNPMDTIAMDHLIITKQGDQTQVLTVVDEFTKYLFIIPVRSIRASATVEYIINNIFMKYGYPRVIHSDNGTSFSNKVMAELCKISGIQQTFSTPRHSQGNAICERANSVILNLFGTLPANQKKNWHKHCDVMAYCYNSSVHSSTGFSPFYLMYGRKPRLVGDAILQVEFEPNSNVNKNHTKNLRLAHDLCRQKLIQERLKFKNIYDQKHHTIATLDKGDIVLHRNYQMKSKIDNRWEDSPYVVLSQPDKDVPVYKVKELNTDIIRICHRNQLLAMFQCENGVDVVKSKVGSKPTHIATDEKDKESNIKSNIDLSTSEDNIQPTSSGPLFLEMFPSTGDIDSDGSNTEEQENQVSSSTHSDATPYYRTRSGRHSKPPDRFSPSKLILRVVSGVDLFRNIVF